MALAADAQIKGLIMAFQKNDRGFVVAAFLEEHTVGSTVLETV